MVLTFFSSTFGFIFSIFLASIGTVGFVDGSLLVLDVFIMGTFSNLGLHSSISGFISSGKVAGLTILIIFLSFSLSSSSSFILIYTHNKI